MHRACTACTACTAHIENGLGTYGASRQAQEEEAVFIRGVNTNEDSPNAQHAPHRPVQDQAQAQDQAQTCTYTDTDAETDADAAADVDSGADA